MPLRTVTVCVTYSNDDKKEYSFESPSDLQSVLCNELYQLSKVISNKFKLSSSVCHFNRDYIDIYYVLKNN